MVDWWRALLVKGSGEILWIRHCIVAVGAWWIRFWLLRIGCVQAGETFIQDGKHAWKELRSSVAVRNDKHVVISLKRSTIDFAGRTILWTVLTILFSRFLLVFAKRFRWGWEEGFSWPRNFRVRDRSLGGKEVIVSKEVKLWEGGPVKKAFNRPVKGVSPLDTVMTTSRSEKDLQRLKMENDPRRFKRVQRETQLPAWWPVSHPVPTMPPEACVQGQRDAHILLRGNVAHLSENDSIWVVTCLSKR